MGYQDNPFNDYICVLRPNNDVALGLQFTVRVDKAEANVRKQPYQTGKIVPQPNADFLKRGDTFQAVGTVVGESINGNNIWYQSAKGNYVWSYGLTRI